MSVTSSPIYSFFFFYLVLGVSKDPLNISHTELERTPKAGLAFTAHTPHE